MSFLLDWQPGQEFEDQVYAVCDRRHKNSANGNAFIALRLRDCSGERVGRWFGPPDGAWDGLKNAEFARVSGVVQDGKWHGEIKIGFAAPAAPPEDLSAFLTPKKASFIARREGFAELVRSVKDEPLKALLHTIFDPKTELWKAFCEAPAARKMHHSHRGGLLEHTAEVATLCDRAASTLPGLDRDLLVTAALLHDIGKLEEMESGLSAGTYTLAGELVGHVVLGTCLVAENAAKIEGFSPQRKHELMHLILSHHGNPEYGAAKRPMCGEAVVLSLCDLMSARVAQCCEATAAAAPGSWMTEIFGWEGVKQIYLGTKPTPTPEP